MAEPSGASSTAAALIREVVSQIEHGARGGDVNDRMEEVTTLGLALLNTPGLEPGVPTVILAQVAAGVIRSLSRELGRDPVAVMQEVVMRIELGEF